MPSLADALAALRLERAAFARLDLPAGERHAPLHAEVREGPRTFVAYHLRAGHCTLETGDGHAVRLGPGAFAVLTRGQAHVLRPVPGSCSVVTGRFDVDAASSPRLVAVLPALLQVEAAPGLQALQSAVLAWITRDAAPASGADAVLRRMAEALLVQAIVAVDASDGDLRRRFAAAGDEIVQRCLALMHRRPEARWTLPLLARELHTSRTVLAERFAAIVGEPPISHLARCRLGAAARLLQQTSWSLARIGEAVGYQSGPAFCRAFRRQFGVPPAAWRRQACAAA